VAAVLAALVATAPAAVADPGIPSDQDVRRARDAAAGAATDVAGIEAELTAAAGRAEAADVALSVAAEDYDAAALELRSRQDVARQAQAAASRATSRLTAAQRDVGRLAAQTYRGGGDLSRLAAVLSPTGPQDVVDRVDLTRSVAGHRQSLVRRMDEARVVATVLDRQATDAVAAAERATRALEAARRAAEARAASAHAVQAGTEQRREVLLGRLAELRRTSVTLERARQAGLAAERERAAVRERERAAARAAAARRAASRTPARDADDDGSHGGSDPAPAPEPAPGPGPGPAPGPPPSGGSSGSAGGGAGAVAWAKRQVGLPYRWGGEGPGSYDCSGLTMRAWQRAGVSLPHSSRAQYAVSQKIPYSRLRPGDLLFFATNPADPRTIHHVTMYAGGGLMVEAPATGLRIRVVPVRHRGEMPWAGRP
jgi:cell wall-associated NlpC family hydrolase